MKELNLDNVLGVCVNRTANLLGKAVLKKLDESIGLVITLEELAVLSRIYEQGPLSMKALAKLTLKDKTTISRLVKPLESKGFVRRNFDINDSRISLLKMTPKGQKLLQKVMPIVFAVLGEATQNVPQKEVTKIVKNLRMINSNLEKMLERE